MVEITAPKLQDVERALGRLQEGSYGRCPGLRRRAFATTARAAGAAGAAQLLLGVEFRLWLAWHPPCISGAMRPGGDDKEHAAALS